MGRRGSLQLRLLQHVGVLDTILLSPPVPPPLLSGLLLVLVVVCPPAPGNDGECHVLSRGALEDLIRGSRCLPGATLIPEGVTVRLYDKPEWMLKGAAVGAFVMFGCLVWAFSIARR